jgi:hypothetical protein
MGGVAASVLDCAPAEKAKSNHEHVRIAFFTIRGIRTLSLFPAICISKLHRVINGHRSRAFSGGSICNSDRHRGGIISIRAKSQPGNSTEMEQENNAGTN